MSYSLPRRLRLALTTLVMVVAASTLTVAVSYAQTTTDAGNAAQSTHCTVYVPPLPAPAPPGTTGGDQGAAAPQIDLNTTCLSDGGVKAAAFVGLAALGILAIVISAALGGKSPLDLVLGADGRPSTSILQFYLWTVFSVFAFVAVWTGRFIGAREVSASDFPTPPNIPTNLLIAMGLSVTTFVAARGITNSQVQVGAVSKGGTGKGGILTNDAGLPDLGKVQLMIWTLIALVVSAASLQFALTHNPIARMELPDIDATLMVLMGLGQGAYLGKKLVLGDTPVITSSSATGKTVKVGDDVVLTGTGFRDSQGNSLLVFDDTSPIPANPWSATSITFAVPALDPRTGAAWSEASKPVNVSVIVNGRESNSTVMKVGATPAPTSTAVTSNSTVMKVGPAPRSRTGGRGNGTAAGVGAGAAHR